jgi:hypothetical protein
VQQQLSASDAEMLASMVLVGDGVIENAVQWMAYLVDALGDYSGRLRTRALMQSRRNRLVRETDHEEYEKMHEETRATRAVDLAVNAGLLSALVAARELLQQQAPPVEAIGAFLALPMKTRNRGMESGLGLGGKFKDEDRNIVVMTVREELVEAVRIARYATEGIFVHNGDEEVSEFGGSEIEEVLGQLVQILEGFPAS